MSLIPHSKVLPSRKPHQALRSFSFALFVLLILALASGCAAPIPAASTVPTVTAAADLPALPAGVDPNALLSGGAGGPPKVITPTIADIPYASTSSA
jgi:hypothetical protein